MFAQPALAKGFVKATKKKRKKNQFKVFALDAAKASACLAKVRLAEESYEFKTFHSRFMMGEFQNILRQFSSSGREKSIQSDKFPLCDDT